MTFLRSTFEPWTRRWTTPVKRIWRQTDFFFSRNLMKVELFRWKCCSTSMKRMEWRRWISRTSVWVSYFSMSFVLSFKYWNQMSDCASSDDVIQNIFQNRKWWMSWRRQGGVKLLTSPKMSWPTRFSNFWHQIGLSRHLNHFQGHQEDFQSGGQRPQWRGFKICKLDWLLLIFFEKQIFNDSEITSLWCRLLWLCFLFYRKLAWLQSFWKRSLESKM